MKTLVFHHFKFIGPLWGMAMFFFFSAHMAGMGKSDMSMASLYFGKIEIFLTFIVSLLVIWFIEGERQDQQLEYLWSLPVSPGKIFYTKVLFSAMVLLSFITFHFIMEMFTSYVPFMKGNELAGSQWGLSKEINWDAIRLHPFIICFMWFSLGLWFSFSKLGRSLPRKVLWPLIVSITATAPWIFLGITYQEKLPLEDSGLHPFFTEASQNIAGDFFEAYSKSYQGLSLSDSYWLTYFFVSIVITAIALICAKNSYASREISPEIESEEN